MRKRLKVPKSRFNESDPPRWRPLGTSPSASSIASACSDYLCVFSLGALWEGGVREPKIGHFRLSEYLLRKMANFDSAKIAPKMARKPVLSARKRLVASIWARMCILRRFALGRPCRDFRVLAQDFSTQNPSPLRCTKNFELSSKVRARSKCTYGAKLTRLVVFVHSQNAETLI